MVLVGPEALGAKWVAGNASFVGSVDVLSIGAEAGAFVLDDVEREARIAGFAGVLGARAALTIGIAGSADAAEVE